MDEKVEKMTPVELAHSENQARTAKYIAELRDARAKAMRVMAEVKRLQGKVSHYVLTDGQHVEAAWLAQHLQQVAADPDAPERTNGDRLLDEIEGRFKDGGASRLLWSDVVHLISRARKA